MATGIGHRQSSCRSAGCSDVVVRGVTTAPLSRYPRLGNLHDLAEPNRSLTVTGKSEPQ
jgi:hypothetical protein